MLTIIDVLKVQFLLNSWIQCEKEKKSLGFLLIKTNPIFFTTLSPNLVWSFIYKPSFANSEFVDCNYMYNNYHLNIVTLLPSPLKFCNFGTW